MDFLKRMNRAMNYIEESLTEKIDVKEATMLTYNSEYHFKRMFSLWLV
ncbi:AraC family transcriptional regulator [Lentibacillus halodurans]|uniref:AraC family transcriptional regulator n=1 Tax=Lentibacillus halodurans TaxID=237679 RepID=A0A1I0WFV1_9BACI|nr:AraC family transcriptional regulator [Lentibacillus halodurans]